MKDELVFAKGKDGHYRYVSKKQLKKKNRGFRIITGMFYLLAFSVILFLCYYFYIDRFEVYLVKKEVSIDNGTHYQIELLPKYSNYFNYENYEYESDNNDVVTIDKYGDIVANNNGEANISVRFKRGYEKKILKVNVTNVDVKSINVENTIAIDKNDTKKVNVTVNNSENVNTAISYESSNEDVFTVDENGNVTALSEGSATLTVKSKNGKKKTSKIVVKSSNEEIQQINIKETNVELKVNKSKNLTLEVVPNNASTKNLIWTSSDPSVVSVTQNGKITGKKVGKAKISVKTKNGLDAICIVNVVEETELLLNTYNETLEVGETANIKTNLPSTFSSSNTSVAVVNSNGAVKAISPGRAIISVTADNGKKSTCTIVVKNSTVEIESISTIESIELKTGDTYKIDVKITPSNAENKIITWSSSNSDIASVNINGIVKANAVGRADIMARTENGKTSKTTVYVNERIINVESVSFDMSSVDVKEGSTVKVTPIIKPDNATNKKVVFSSEDETIATVDDNGVIKGIKSGTTKIKVEASNSKSASIVVNVKKVVYEVTSIKLNKTSVTLEIGSTDKLVATITPSNATVKTVSFNTSDSKIVSVDGSGNIKALSEGKAIVSAIASNGMIAKCDVTVKAIPVKTLTLNKTTLNLKVGDTSKLSVSIAPSNATNKKVTWSSSNATVASVDASGNIKALKEGSTKITVTSVNGITSTCTVNVEKLKPTKITLEPSYINLTEGSSTKLSVTYTPSNATDKELVYKSNNTAVATVSSSGQIVGVKAGSAKITAYLKSDETIKSEVAVSVTAKNVEVSGVSLDKTTANVEEGSTIKLTHIISPSNATNKTVTWTSSDNSIATVSNGVVKGIKAGKAQITVKSSNGKSSSCIVTVLRDSTKVVSISITSNATYVNVGKSISLGVSVNPTTATNKSVTWSSSNTSVASVSSSGVVTGKKEGSVTIKAVSNSNSSAIATKTILVKSSTIPVSSITLSNTEITINKGATYTLTATVSPSNATNKNVTWEVTNSKAAKVDSNGKVTGLNPGGTYVKAISSDGKIEAKCMVNVRDVVNVTSVALNTNNVTLDIGKSYQLKPTISPSNATNKSVTYKSSNTAVASVDTTGKITARKKGVAKITATSNNGKTYSVNVIVLGYTSVQKYEGSTLRYYIEKPNDKHLISRIWVKDAYNQLKVALAKNYSSAKMDSKTLVSKEVSKKGYSSKALIAVNASPMYQGAGNCKHDSYFKAMPYIPVVFNDGSLVQNYYDKYYDCYHFNNNDEVGEKSIYLNLYGLTKDGVWQHYEMKKGYNDYNKKVLEEMKQDGIKYNVGFSGIIIDNRKNGKHISNNLSDKRQIMCQIDKNNYIIFTGTCSGSSCMGNGDIANLLADYGCVSAFNFDGGGSNSLIYKGNTSTITRKVTGRDTSDILYFVEQ